MKNTQFFDSQHGTSVVMSAAAKAGHKECRTKAKANGMKLRITSA